MELVACYGKKELALVFVGRTSMGNEVEFVESIQPPLSRNEKEVIIISTLVGCPVGCSMCDAGGFYGGKLTAKEMLEQIEYVVNFRFGGRKVPSKKFKIQFARMGEPAFNDAVIDVLDRLPEEFEAPGLLPSVSTIAPKGREAFFERLYWIKERHYRGRFQLQFSIHSTDLSQRDEIIPVPKWHLEKIAEYGKEFVKEGDRKITLNFALSKDNIVDPGIIIKHFDPEKFLIKITPVNPTYSAKENGIVSGVDVFDNRLPHHPGLLEALEKSGYDVILSIGELEENKIGSNCGQYVKKHLSSDMELFEAYSYNKMSLNENKSFSQP